MRVRNLRVLIGRPLNSMSPATSMLCAPSGSGTSGQAVAATVIGSASSPANAAASHSPPRGIRLQPRLGDNIRLDVAYLEVIEHADDRDGVGQVPVGQHAAKVGG